MYNNSVFIDDSEVEETEDEVAKIKKWALQNNISQIALQELMNILRNKLLPQLPVSVKSFVGTKYTFNIENFVDPEEEHYQYVYFGLREGLSCINTALHINKVPLQINIDGIPLYKSSRKQLWPILCKVHHDPDIYKPFVVGIFCGYNKPKNINQYFRKFINEINTLQHDGLLISNRLIKPYIKCFVCDSPARSFLKGIKGHGGFSACERCTVHGERISNRTVYSEINALERTNESFRAQNDLEHHVAITPLLTIIPEIDMIQIFVLDSMHLGYTGKMQKKYEKKFMIVEFANCLNDNGIADIDVVPSKWIYYNDEEETCKTPYPNPPYDECTCKFLHSRVKNLLPPLSSWPSWPIIIKGSASNYKSAENRLQKLKEEAFAFSTDVDGLSPANKAEKYTKKYRKTALRKLFQVPVIGENLQQNPKRNGEN
ncbi:hypothetical protein ALC57_03748 [Trachymyrmex cornetzi]|uniref:Uncharacterized protein n=1 Tax=Trachymyrmex cornetzi TaxID=471704 RepID=A0A151JM82_9HYME|nr:hypothetical protein ALC57_03748 [Trachymyrmex cornetzi]